MVKMTFNKLPSIFIPICLYSKTFYRKKENMKYLFSKYIQTSEATLIVICDDLHAYNLIIRGNCSTIDEAFKKAKKQGENLLNMILNIQKQFTEVEDLRITMWTEIASQNKYTELLQNLKNILEQDKELEAVINEFVTLHIRKFRWSVHKDAAKWEERYLLQEIIMSIYVTEILGYSRELWENAPDPNSPDPIGYLYQNRPELVQRLVGKKTLIRKLEILEVPQDKVCTTDG